MRRLLFLSLFWLPKVLYGDAQPYYQGVTVGPSIYEGLPWLTGTLLSPSENVVPSGTWNLEPYLLFNTQYGRYDKKWHSHSLSNNIYKVLSETFLQYGIASRCDVQIAPQFSWNHTQGASEWTVGDLGFVFDFQLLYMKEERWWPNVKLVVGGYVPLGKYQHLNPNKKGTDSGGTGSINPTAGIVIGRVFPFSHFHFLRTRVFASYTVPNSVHVKGLNAYGGGKGTCGRVYPGQVFTGIFSIEYTFTVNWVLSFDLQYAHTNTQRFKGRTRAPMKEPSSESWSLAPAIEYNWNQSVGVISGVWLTAAGRNSPAFANWTSAVNVNF